MQTAVVQDQRRTLLAEIEATGDSFRHLVERISDVTWNYRAPGSKWTGKQLLHHLTWALEQLPLEVESAKREKGMFNYPKLIADTGSLWLVKWQARRQTRESLLARYESALERVVGALASVEDRDWTRGAKFYGEGFYSVADLFHTAANHFQEHAATLVDR